MWWLIENNLNLVSIPKRVSAKVKLRSTSHLIDHLMVSIPKRVSAKVKLESQLEQTSQYLFQSLKGYQPK